MTETKYDDLGITIKFSKQKKEQLLNILSLRDGETKLGENIQLLDAGQPLEASAKSAKANGARFALLGITEDIGPRANLGRGGAAGAFEPVLNQLIHFQSNEYLNGTEILVVGSIDVVQGI